MLWIASDSLVSSFKFAWLVFYLIIGRNIKMEVDKLEPSSSSLVESLIINSTGIILHTRQIGRKNEGFV